MGERVWSRFTVGREPMLWYLGAMSEALAEGFAHEIVDELRRTVGLLHEAAARA